MFHVCTYLGDYKFVNLLVLQLCLFTTAKIKNFILSDKFSHKIYGKTKKWVFRQCRRHKHSRLVFCIFLNVNLPSSELVRLNSFKRQTMCEELPVNFIVELFLFAGVYVIVVRVHPYSLPKAN